MPRTNQQNSDYQQAGPVEYKMKNFQKVLPYARKLFPKGLEELT